MSFLVEIEMDIHFITLDTSTQKLTMSDKIEKCLQDNLVVKFYVRLLKSIHQNQVLDISSLISPFLKNKSLE